ncbi:MAG: aromatic amino acid transport family protein [Patescibacteria group bacterium]|nr:aromatic amino acid transport family protein [Patescibacteria group bacterium]MDD5172662.1 aromatic amino acid transport family protein [Patescibacteria group bacterium]
MNKKYLFIKAISVLIGTIIGAGIFGLPYAFAQGGFLLGLFYLLLLTGLFLIAKLCYTEIILRTNDNLEMAGYVERYSGRLGKIIITLCLIFGTYGALTAYTIGVGEFLYSLLNPILGGTQVFWSIIFWVLASILIFIGIGIISRIEVFMVFVLIFIIFFVFLKCFPYFNFQNLKYVNLDWRIIFFPYGPILFALGGASAIPTMRRILKDKTYLLKRAVIIGFFIPVIIYLIFAFIVVGVSGKQTSETALIGLTNFTDGNLLLIGGVFGIFAMTTSFLALGHFLKELFHRDYHLPKIVAGLSVVSVPLIFFLIGMRSFITVISFAGGVLSGMQGIILIVTYYRAKKKGDRQPEFSFNLPRLLAYFIYFLFIFGIVYQFIYV